MRPAEWESDYCRLCTAAHARACTQLPTKYTGKAGTWLRKIPDLGSATSPTLGCPAAAKTPNEEMNDSRATTAASLETCAPSSANARAQASTQPARPAGASVGRRRSQKNRRPVPDNYTPKGAALRPPQESSVFPVQRYDAPLHRSDVTHIFTLSLR